MKKLINDVPDVVTESLAGFGRAHADIVRVSQDPKFVARADGHVRRAVEAGRVGPVLVMAALGDRDGDGRRGGHDHQPGHEDLPATASQ